MLALLFLLATVAIVFVWLLYKVTIYALPCAVALEIGRLASQSGAGWFGGLVLGVLAALALFEMMRWSYSPARSLSLRVLSAALFAGSSTIMGYNVLSDLTEGRLGAEATQHAFCVIGACGAGAIALVRLSAPE